MPRRSTKQDQIGALIAEFRTSGNQDRAFDVLAAERLGVSPTDLHCLNIIENLGGLTAGELGRKAGLSSGAVTGVIDRLERAGYAQRVPDPADRRKVSVKVTARFRSRAAVIWGPLASEWQATLASKYSAAEIEAIIGFLTATNAIAARHIARLAGEPSR